jgi:hypothetical protein
MSTRKKNDTDVHLALAKPSKSRDKDLQNEAGDDIQDAEDNHAEDFFEDQEPPTDDMASLQKQLAKLQKQFARMEQNIPSMKPSASNDRAASGPAHSPVTHPPSGKPASESMTRSCRSGTGSTSTRTSALSVCCCTSTIAFRMHMNVIVSMRPSNS